MNYIEKIVGCVCGCHLIKLSKYPDDDQVYLEAYENSFYSTPGGKVKRYFQRLWSAICGKEHLLFDIVLSHEESIEMADWLQSEELVDYSPNPFQGIVDWLSKFKTNAPDEIDEGKTNLETMNEVM